MLRENEQHPLNELLSGIRHASGITRGSFPESQISSERVELYTPSSNYGCPPADELVSYFAYRGVCSALKVSELNNARPDDIGPLIDAVSTLARLNVKGECSCALSDEGVLLSILSEEQIDDDNLRKLVQELDVLCSHFEKARIVIRALSPKDQVLDLLYKEMPRDLIWDIEFETDKATAVIFIEREVDHELLSLAATIEGRTTWRCCFREIPEDKSAYLKGVHITPLHARIPSASEMRAIADGLREISHVIPIRMVRTFGDRILIVHDLPNPSLESFVELEKVLRGLPVASILADSDSPTGATKLSQLKYLIYSTLPQGVYLRSVEALPNAGAHISLFFNEKGEEKLEAWLEGVTSNCSGTLHVEKEKLSEPFEKWLEGKSAAVSNFFSSMTDHDGGVILNADVDMKALLLKTVRPVEAPKEFTNPARRSQLAFRPLVIDYALTHYSEDAYSVELLEEGLIRLTVHLADAAAFVRRHSLMEQAARERGAAIYAKEAGTLLAPLVPLGVLKAGSFIPNETRPALSVSIDLLPDGTVSLHDHLYSTIKPDARLSFTTYYESLQGRLFGDALSQISLWSEAAKHSEVLGRSIATPHDVRIAVARMLSLVDQKLSQMLADRDIRFLRSQKKEYGCFHAPFRSYRAIVNQLILAGHTYSPELLDSIDAHLTTGAKDRNFHRELNEVAAVINRRELPTAGSRIWETF